MTKITAEHLGRGAFIYIRQSTADQLVHNQESQRRQYGLADRARQLGWTSIEVIDDDLGRSGGGVNRPGFERLLAAICEGRVGAVFAIEASRLARNGRDWHTLIEFCGLVGTIIVDEDGIYDPRHPNDRLLLGMKGTMSELELSLFRQRSHEALKQKARRGALFLRVSAGYVRDGRDRIEKDPDQRVQDAIRLVFAKFTELQSARQVHVWLRDEGVTLPSACHNPQPENREATKPTNQKPQSLPPPAPGGCFRPNLYLSQYHRAVKAVWTTTVVIADDRTGDRSEKPVVRDARAAKMTPVISTAALGSIATRVRQRQQDRRPREHTSRLLDSGDKSQGGILVAVGNP